MRIVKRLSILLILIFNVDNLLIAQKQYGFMNIKQEVIIPAKFERVGYFVDGLALAQMKNLWGYINTKGDFVIEPKYKYAEPFEYGFAKVSYKEQSGFTAQDFLYINIKGVEITADKILKEPVYMFGMKPNIVNGKYGYINTGGKQAIPALYDYAGPFNRGGIAVVTKGEAYGCINKTGKLIVPCVNLSPIAIGTVGYVSIANYDNCKIYDSTGAFIVVPNVNDIYTFERGNITTFRVDNKYGYINTKGKILVPAEYDEAGSCSEGLAKVKKNNQLIVLDVINNRILSYVGDGNDYYSFTNGKAVVIQKEKYGLIDKNNNIIIPIKYEWLSVPSNDSLIGFAINYISPAPIKTAQTDTKMLSNSERNTTVATNNTQSQSPPTTTSGNISSSSYKLDLFSELGSMALYVSSRMYVVKIKGKRMENEATVASRAAQAAGISNTYKYQWFAGKNCTTLKNLYSSAFTIYCNGEVDLKN